MPNPSLLAQQEEEDRNVPRRRSTALIRNEVAAERLFRRVSSQRPFFVLIGSGTDLHSAGALLRGKGYKLAQFTTDYGDADDRAPLRALSRYLLHENCAGTIVLPGWEEGRREQYAVYLATLLSLQTLCYFGEVRGEEFLVQFDRDQALVAHIVCSVLDEVDRLMRAETFFRPRPMPATPHPLTPHPLTGRSPLG